ncbi:Na+/H+ antiporter NhaD [Reichenbachiella faecimaris]|uniref:Na+/H+ antiporter NhaD n=1 Tax=Reichenbachiella faecimaris TaxID=692418 RepID=A0A1W2GE50_REIFA|nr:sodium:proton antiporter [Reichenbachiella faecimaris]SMD34927.1 Na+/H+ antiporter NhaD [Reichenbachiella faecimaris]
MYRYLVLIILLCFSLKGYAGSIETIELETSTVELASNTEAVAEIVSDDAHHHAPSWSVIPFALLLIMIATGPLFYEHFWHKNYPIVACVLAGLVVLYYLFGLHNMHAPVHALAEYVQFIALLSGLFIASGGIMIEVDKEAKPMTNVIILLIGALISNIIGTTGASMLLIRPFIRLNKNRIKPYHIIFFIFMVSNIGGSLTPIGDPPLFLGFLKGVPFFWTLQYNILPWIFACLSLAVVFYFTDKKNKADYSFGESTHQPSNTVTFVGTKNFLWLAVIVGAVFLDPNVLDWVPAIHYDGQKFSYIREIIMLTGGFLSYKFANKEALQWNEFNFEPIREVAFIFIGIFGTMMPALELVGNFAQSDAGAAMITHNTLYWGTGLLSGFLDNAPTYINFLTAALASQGGSITTMADVVGFSNGEFVNSILSLKAISIAAVFFGSMTYIGNGPNFMVKSIAEQVGIKMPSFFGYIIRFSIPILLPLFVIVWLIFFYWQLL